MADIDDIWARKHEKLHREPKMKPLVEFVEYLRERSEGRKVPNFDPDDGGIDAEVLFVFQDPGPTVEATNFISRDNYLVNPKDHSAMRVIEASDEADLHRERTVSWNAIPWHVTAKERGREFTKVKNKKYMPELLKRFEGHNNFKAVALFGSSYAWRLTDQIREIRPDLEIFKDYHPSDLGLPSKQKKEHFKKTFRQIKEFLG